MLRTQLQKMMYNYMKEQRFITVHEENLRIARFLGIIAIVISVFYTVRGIFYGGALIESIIKSWLSGFGIVALLFDLLIALIFFLIGYYIHV